MLLLTAIILLIGFIALSGMVIRVSQLPEETTQESRRPIDLEAGAVAHGVLDLLLRTEERVPIGDDVSAYADSVQQSLDSLAVMEQGRGFRFEWIPNGDGIAVTCDDVVLGETVRVNATVALHDVDTRIQVTIEATFGDAADPRSCQPIA